MVDRHNTASNTDRSGLFARFRRSREGSTAIEFAMVSIPFFTLLFAIIETALLFFVGQMLESSASQAARQIRTGQAHQAAMTREQMEEQICTGMINLTNCLANLHLDVRTYASFGAVSLGSPLDESGEFTDLQYDIGATSQIVVVRAFYTWPKFFHLLPTTSSLPDGSYLLGSVIAFRNEPFPW
jgi:Flp pilus assembly protein TadG